MLTEADGMEAAEWSTLRNTQELLEVLLKLLSIIIKRLWGVRGIIRILTPTNIEQPNLSLYILFYYFFKLLLYYMSPVLLWEHSGAALRITDRQSRCFY